MNSCVMRLGTVLSVILAICSHSVTLSAAFNGYPPNGTAGGWPEIVSSGFSPDGKIVFLLDYSGYLTIWSTQPIRQIERYRLYQRNENMAAFGFTGEITKSQTVLLLSKRNGEVYEVKPRIGIRHYSRYSPDSRFVQIIGAGTRLAFWESSNTITVCTLPDERIVNVQRLGGIVPDRMSAAESGKIFAAVWPNGKLSIRRPKGHYALANTSGTIVDVGPNFSSSGLRFACFGSDGENSTIQVWSGHRSSFVVSRIRGPVAATVVSPSGRWIAIVRGDQIDVRGINRTGAVERIGYTLGKHVKGSWGISPPPITGLHFSPDDRSVLIGGPYGHAFLWNFKQHSVTDLTARWHSPDGPTPSQ